MDVSFNGLDIAHVLLWLTAGLIISVTGDPVGTWTAEACLAIGIGVIVAVTLRETVSAPWTWFSSDSERGKPE